MLSKAKRPLENERDSSPKRRKGPRYPPHITVLRIFKFCCGDGVSAVHEMTVPHRVELIRPRTQAS